MLLESLAKDTSNEKSSKFEEEEFRGFRGREKLLNLSKLDCNSLNAIPHWGSIINP